MQILTDEEIDSIVRDTIGFLKVGYREYGTISPSSIETLADLLYTHHIRFDGEFKTICYEWEYRHRQSTVTEFLERYVR